MHLAGWVCLGGSAIGALAAPLLLEQRMPTATESSIAAGCLAAAVAAGAGRRRLETQSLITSAGIGLVGGSGLWLVQHTPRLWQLGAYGMALAFFHASEFLVTAQYNADSLSFDSFLVNHSWSYGVAAAASWAEYGLELHFLPQLKEYAPITLAGLALVVGGELLRKVAMITAASNFNHIVATKRRQDHELVTHGVYQICRHPSYAGWFWWAVGTQLLLANPVCVLAYAAASYRFFSDRVEFEEENLLRFFGAQYDSYQDRVGTGVPFVKGFRASENHRNWWRREKEQKERAANQSQ